VRSICPRTWCNHSKTAFVFGFLTMVGLRCIPYDTHRCSKCNLNSDPLSYMSVWNLGYLHNQFCLLIFLFYLSSCQRYTQFLAAPCRWHYTSLVFWLRAIPRAGGSLTP
jgi:hypothetical protein